jgi:hypothetical protein
MLQVTIRTRGPHYATMTHAREGREGRELGKCVSKNASGRKGALLRLPGPGHSQGGRHSEAAAGPAESVSACLRRTSASSGQLRSSVTGRSRLAQLLQKGLMGQTYSVRQDKSDKQGGDTKALRPLRSRHVKKGDLLDTPCARGSGT